MPRKGSQPTSDARRSPTYVIPLDIFDTGVFNGIVWRLGDKGSENAKTLNAALLKSRMIESSSDVTPASPLVFAWVALHKQAHGESVPVLPTKVMAEAINDLVDGWRGDASNDAVFCSMLYENFYTYVVDGKRHIGLKCPAYRRIPGTDEKDFHISNFEVIKDSSDGTGEGEIVFKDGTTEGAENIVAHPWVFYYLDEESRWWDDTEENLRRVTESTADFPIAPLHPRDKNSLAEQRIALVNELFLGYPWLRQRCMELMHSVVGKEVDKSILSSSAGFRA